MECCVLLTIIWKKGEIVLINLDAWMERYLRALTETFGERLYFVGLQGSYGRGEATERSDIDLVVILDQLTSADINVYRDMLDTLSHRELICGFVSGKEELLNWEPSDLFQFYYDTTALFGTLDELLANIDATAVARAIKTGACNLYHGCVHNMIFDQNEEILRGLYKSAVFVMQALAFCESGHYVKTQKELLAAAKGKNKEIVEIAISLKRGACVEFDAMSEPLLHWSSNLITQSEYKCAQ